MDAEILPETGIPDRSGSSLPPDLGMIVQRTVADGILPALVVVHDPEGDWLVGDGVNDPNVADACGLYCLAHVVETDPTIEETLAMGSGFAAYRDAPGQPWGFEPFAFEDDDQPEL